MRFEEFAARRLPAVLRFAAVLAGDRAGAEDVVQEVLIRVYQRWDQIGGLDRPESYVRKVIVNEFISSHRRLWRLVPAGRGSDLDDRVTPDHSGGQVEREALLAELAKLPARQRAVVVLRYYEELPDGQIAEVLGCAPATVRSLAFRALATLRADVSEQRAMPRKDGS